MSFISAENPIPLYQQLKQLITEQIKSGELKPGDKLFSERELCDQYKVSRITVRQTLAELEKEGLINRVHGKGTFVAQPKVEQELFTITPFQTSLLSQGFKPKTKLLDHGVIANSYAISRVLDIPLVEQIFTLSLLGLDDETPMAYYTSYFSLELGQKMYKLAETAAAEGKSFTTLDLYQYIPEFVLGIINQTIEASIADSYIANILQIKKGSPIFIVTSIIYSTEDKPLEKKTAIYRGDRYRFTVVRKPPYIKNTNNL